MASNSKDDEALELLWAAHFNELRSMSDADIMEGVDLPKFRTDRIQALASVKAEVGRRRLASARAELDAAKTAGNPAQPPVSLAEARAFLHRAANDSRFTMAARALDDMTDEMVLRTYARLKDLMAQDSEDGKS